MAYPARGAQPALVFTTVIVSVITTPAAVDVDDTKLDRMSLRTALDRVRTLEVAPLDVLVPSAGYGPFVSVGSATHVPDDELDELDELLLDELLELEELDELLLDVPDPPDEVPPPPQPATSAAIPALPNQARALRRSMIWLDMV